MYSNTPAYIGLTRIGVQKSVAIVTDPPSGFFVCTAGQQFYVNGRVQFPPAVFPKPDLFYRTRFGPAVIIKAIIPCKCNDCTSLAVTRITALRAGDLPGYDAHLRANQRHFLATERVLTAWGNTFRITTNSVVEEISEHAMDPHPKKKLRIAAFADLESGRLTAASLRNVNYKMKPNEYMLSTKVPRAIGDLGVGASLYGFRITSFIKEAQSKPFSYQGCYFKFIKKPDHAELVDAFQKLLNPPEQSTFIFFSDDSCFSKRTPTGVRIFNVDISKCDRSHTHELFYKFRDILPEHIRSHVQTLIDQCARPIKIYDVNERKRFVKLRPTGPMLYSGSTLTTTLNNLASFTIGYALSCVQPTEQNLINAAESVGYIITLDECLIPEDIQFLKHSPAYDVNGEMQPVLNLGVYLRASGVCKGDLPGRGDIELRAKKFQFALLNGMFPRLRTPLIDLAKTITDQIEVDPASGNLVQKEFEYKLGKTQDVVLDTHSFLKRYRLTHRETMEIHEFFQSTVFTGAANTGLSKVLQKDYEMESYL